MKIPFLDLQNINSRFEKQFQDSFTCFLNKGHYILGDQVAHFENRFADYCNASHAIGVASGLDALFLIMKAYQHLGNLSTGDEVLVSANTYIATILAIKHAGLTPVFVEPDLRTYNMDMRLLSTKLSSNTKAIMVTHLYGNLSDMSFLRAFCDQHNLLLLTDASQAHGAQGKDRNPVGSMADAAGFSCYPTKNLGALGDAGIVVTSNSDLDTSIRQLRNYGTSSKNSNAKIGYNSRLDELQAVFLNIKLNSLDSDNQKRIEIAKFYLSNICNPKIELPSWEGGKSHVFHQFVILVEDRKAFRDFLACKGVQTMVHYPIPPHRQKAFVEYESLNLPITEMLSKKVVSLPIHPILTKEQVKYIVDTVNAYV